MTKTQNDPHHPKSLPSNAGILLEPLFTWHGMDVYPVFGASQPSGEPDSEPDDDEEEEGAGEGSEGEGGSAEKSVSQSEFDALRRQLQAADKRRNEAEKRLKDLDDAQKDELTKATEKVAELEAELQKREADIASMRMENAFLTAKTDITWHDPGDALALAERKGYLEGVVVDSKVDGNALVSKLKEMAKAHPYLVKSGPDNQERPSVPTGAPVGAKPKKRSSDEPDLSRYGRFLQR